MPSTQYIFIDNQPFSKVYFQGDALTTKTSFVYFGRGGIKVLKKRYCFSLLKLWRHPGMPESGVH